MAIYAERGNRVKTISESDIQKYVEQGYTITNGQGTVLQETVPTDVPTLRLAYKQHIDEIKRLKDEITELKAQKAVKPAKVVVETEEVADDQAKPEKSTRGKKSTKTEE